MAGSTPSSPGLLPRRRGKGAPSLSRKPERGEGARSGRTPLQFALAALARRDYSRTELERLLDRKWRTGDADDGPSAEIARTLDDLQAQGFLSDARMAQSWVRARSGRYGRLRIRRELEDKGIEDETISAVLPSPADEAGAAFALWQRKFGQLPQTPQERARQGRFLAARGFDAELIHRILSGAAQDRLGR